MPEPRQMPSFDKSPAELIERFDRLVARMPPDVERRKMFGYPALFVGGNLATGLFGAAWMIRLPDAALAEIRALPGGGAFEPMPGRPMKGYALVPQAVVADDAELDGWILRAVGYVRAMPAKPGKG
ncbi:MAG: TfoX/Sxy family protein [Candidatus Limnocylindrales bacterium]